MSLNEIMLSDLNYITAKHVTALKKSNIETVEDLLFNFPNKFDDYTISTYNEAEADVNVTLAGVIQSKATVVNAKTKLSIMTFFAEVDNVKIKVTIFNRHFLRSKICYGEYVRLTGKFKADKKNFVASEIHFDEFSNSINPVFNIKGITDEKLLELKEKVFYDYEYLIEETLPEEILKKHNLIGLKDAIRYINIPEDMDEVKRAIERIKFEELFIYELKIKYLLYMRKHHPQGVSIDYHLDKVNDFKKTLPFNLTPDQETSLQSILYDLKAPYKMNRLLQGEVGSGKTIVAALSLYAVITAGYQGAIMVPTEVLANQHFATFKELFANSTVRVEMLSSSITSSNRKQILEDLKNDKINILIGTHALFQKDVEFHKLGLVITDEEHRFGVRQRVSIVGKGYLIDHLKMSATPIPRTLAISVLGESDISVIKTLPGNKKEAITKFVSYSERMDVLEHMRKELADGHQIYVITPMIEESDSIDLNNANEVYEKMVRYFDGVCKVGLIHSKLKTVEKEEVMNAFSKNEIQILVSTSVIEVGVNVVNATTIVILDADRFGIAQLHQMRGRVRRSDNQAYCFLVSDTRTQSSIDRLRLVEANSDGFVLAEEDLLIRGPGDFFGEKQTGVVTFKMADLVTDRDLLEVVNEEANLAIETENLFNKEEYKYILDVVDENYRNNKDMLD